MGYNLLILAVSAFIPLLVGAVWYNPKVFGTMRMQGSGVNAEKLSGARLAGLCCLTWLLSFFIAIALNFMFVHQFQMYSALSNFAGFGKHGAEVDGILNGLMVKYGSSYRTFEHGAVHGAFAGFTFALPVIWLMALYEQRPFRYVAVHAGFWIVSCALMGGLLCRFI